MWYDECDFTRWGLPLNCPSNKSAQPLTDQASLSVLKTWCPDFIEDHSKGMKFSISIVNLLGNELGKKKTNTRKKNLQQ